MKVIKIILLLAILSLIAAFFIFDLKQYLTLAFIKSEQHLIESHYDSQPLLVLAIFALIYIVYSSLSIPGVVILSIASGAIFGFQIGLIVSSFSFSIGSTFAFLSSRFLFRDFIQARFSDRLKIINDGIEKDGVFYLFSLRMIPIFPYFVFNLLTGLTNIKIWTFYWVTQTGSLAAAIICVNAGTQLAKIESLKDIFTPILLISLALIGVFPLIIKKVIQIFSKEKVSSQ
jgi:uncharacterized membrane protein YdjX (TVP38/TMEM64 family)